MVEVLSRDPKKLDPFCGLSQAQWEELSYKDRFKYEVKYYGFFWDDKNQRDKAWHRAKKNPNIDFSNYRVKYAMREECRKEEGRYNSGFKTVKRNKRWKGLGGLEPPISSEPMKTKKKEIDTRSYHYKKPLPKIPPKPRIKEKKEDYNNKNPKHNPNNRSLARPSNSSPQIARLDPNARPEPTGFRSPLKLVKWLVHYFPNVYDPDLYDIQKDMIKFLNNNPWAMIEIFRSAGKSKLVMGILCYIICENPNERLFLLAEEIKKGIQRVRTIRNMLGSPRIIEDYGYLINDSAGKSVRKGKSTELMFECHRDIDAFEPTLMAITWQDSQALGYHYTGGVMDDPWSKKLQNQEGAKAKWMDWWGEFQGCLDICRFLYILCTKKGVKDLYLDLEGLKMFKLLKVPLVQQFPDSIKLLTNKEGDIYTGAAIKGKYKITDTCHGKYSMTIHNRDPKKGKIKFCIPVLRHNDPLNFQMEYQQEPYLPDGDVFKWEHANLYNRRSQDPLVFRFFKQFNSIKKIGIMDLAFGESERSDFNVLLVMALYRRRFFIIDAWVGKWSAQKRIEVIRKFGEKYPGTPLYIEADMAQIAWVKDIRKRVNTVKIRDFISRGKGRNYQILYEGEEKASKKGKIHDALAVPWSDGNFYISKELPCLSDLELQLKQFPRCDVWDIIDTLAMGVIVLRKSMNSAVIAINRI